MLHVLLILALLPLALTGFQIVLPFVRGILWAMVGIAIMLVLFTSIGHNTHYSPNPDPSPYGGLIAAATFPIAWTLYFVIRRHLRRR